MGDPLEDDDEIRIDDVRAADAAIAVVIRQVAAAVAAEAYEPVHVNPFAAASAGTLESTCRD